MKRVVILISILLPVFLIVPFLWKTQVERSVFRASEAKATIGDGDDINARLNYEVLRLHDPATGKIPENIREKELKFARQMVEGQAGKLRKGSSQNGQNWESRGPINRGGRTRALAVDIRTQTPGSVTLIAGGVSGGIYKSTDDGQSWVNKLAPELIHSITCIAQDTRPGHEDTWYVGSGETKGNSASGGGAFFFGDGIFKSTDNGETWTPLASTTNDQLQIFNSEFRFVNNIAVNKTTGSIFAATSNTVVRSKDGGASWSTIVGRFANNIMSDVQITSDGIIYTAIPSGEASEGITRLTDDGAIWKDITPADFPTVYKRTVIAISPSNENIVYFFVQTPDQGPTNTQLWKYDDALTTWINLTDSLPTIGGKSGTLSTQGGYDMVLKVKPDDSNFVVLGGTNLYRSTDGFTSKVGSSGWIGGYQSKDSYAKYPNHHPDQHSLVFLSAPNSSVLYSGSDGGISRTDDVTQASVAWTTLNTGYITSQFYSLAIDPGTAFNNIIIGGLQDNGNYYTNSADGTVPWVELPLGGDGGYTAIADGHSEYYFETQKGDIWKFRLDENGKTTKNAFIKPNYTTSYLFATPFVLDPVNNQMMYFAAGDSVFRNSDLSGISWGNSNATNKNWSALSSSSTGSLVSALGVSKSPANRLYVGSSKGKILRIDGADAGDPPSLDVSTGKGLPVGYVNCLYVDPDNADKVMAVFSNYGIPSLYYTTDAGSSWVDVSGNLEQNPDGSGNGPSCRWVTKVVFGGSDIFYLASSTGLYSTDRLDSNATVWQPEGANTIGNVVSDMVVSRASDNLIAVATHGAGIFSAQYNKKLPATIAFYFHQDFAAGNEPVAVASGDINMDGKNDIAVVNEYAPYHLDVLLNQSASSDTALSFVRKTVHVYPLGSFPQSVAVSDINGDNKPDVAVANYSGDYVSIFVNATLTGDTALGFTQNDIDTENGPNFIAFDDFNNDGKPDMAVANNSNFGKTVSVFINNTLPYSGEASFFSKRDFTVGNNPHSLAIADINDDGKVDIIAPNYNSGSFSVLLNSTGDGDTTASFLDKSDFIVKAYNYPTDIAVGDLNDDGKPDLLIGNESSDDSVSVFFNMTMTGAEVPSFSKRYALGTGLQFSTPKSVVIRDFNGDGKPDLAAGNFSTHIISVFQNTISANSFTPSFERISFETVDAPQSIISDDFNGDERADLVTASWNHENISVLINAGDFVTAIKKLKTRVPSGFTLKQNYPNPFNPTTHISFYVPRASSVSLKVYDLLGRQLREINQGNLQKGNHSFTFDARGLASGVYIYRISATNGANSVSAVKKMIVLK